MVWDIFGEIERMNRELNFFNRNFFGKSNKHLLGFSKGKGLQTSQFRTPLCDIKETDDKILAKIELPGVEKKDIELNITDDRIEVKVEKKERQEIKEKDSYMCFERTDSFFRRISLPAEVKSENTIDTYENGVLKIEAPKKQVGHKKSKRIDIK
ncbi:Hsp20/alpha crystallin family protein [Candidatus Woesearchaeota archaeon]|nr:Hsp20/alpha crystallin family protein [Candidatus Woesearchaeota archaeon]